MRDGDDLPPDRLHAELERLRAQNLRFETALENLNQGVCFYDGEQRLILCNGRYLDLYGLAPGAIGPGSTLREVTEARIRAGSFPDMDGDAYLRWRDAVVQEDKPHNSVVELGNGRIIAIHHRPMPDRGWVATHEDITESRRAEERIAHLASHDPLTGLDNRHVFHVRLEQAARAWVPESAVAALLYLDLDQFKSVNDAFGHAAGDRLLRDVAERLRGLCRRVDTVARLGGDEFAVIVADVRAAHEAEALAARMIEAIAQPYVIERRELLVTASIGIALCTRGELQDPERLMRAADLALYQAKSEGRNTWRMFRPEMLGVMRARDQLDAELRHALQANQLELYYQPQVDLDTEQVVGAEALIRWHHPTRGLVPPAEFIPFSEESDLILHIGEWVLRTACRDAAPWRPLRVAVNVSPVQFRAPGLVDLIARVLHETGLEPGRLEIEITERVLIGDHAATANALQELEALGVRLAVDDFGIGYSSFDYLRRFPFKKLKIDGSFIRDLGTDSSSSAIIRAIVGMCRQIGLQVNAEGVETRMQAAMLRTEGCGEGQGFLYGRAMPAAEFIRTIGIADPAAADASTWRDSQPVAA